MGGRLAPESADSPLRHHWVKARVRIHHYPDGTLALFHGPACIARYDAQGRPQAAIPIASRARPCPALSHATTDRPPLPDPTLVVTKEADN